MALAMSASERRFSGNARMRSRISCCMAATRYEFVRAPQRGCPRRIRIAYSGVMYRRGAGDLDIMSQICLRVITRPSRLLAATMDE